MTAYDFVIQQLREYFADASRLRAELVLLGDRLVRAETKIHTLEVALAERDAEDVVASGSEKGEGEPKGSEKGTRLVDSSWARDGSVFTVPFVLENKQAKGNSHDKKE